MLSRELQAKAGKKGESLRWGSTSYPLHPREGPKTTLIVTFLGADVKIVRSYSWERRGPNWYNPENKQSLHPDLDHPEPLKPHWDWKDSTGKWWRLYPDGSIEPK